MPIPASPTAAPTPDRAAGRRVELILGELEALPTLNAVAVRILELTTDVETDAQEVVQLVASDPALATRVLALCRCHERGRASEVTSVERAVLLLGFEAVRTAVLAVQVFDVLDDMDSPGGERQRANPTFDREAFWLHSLAVAVVAEQLATRGTQVQDLNGGEAFTAGLLHDLGQLVLHVLLPESFDRVCQVTETHSASLDRACRQIIGIDTHTAGKKLAEHWGLPQALTDVIWLNGQPFEGLPATCNRRLVATITLADALVRSRYITAGGQWARSENLATLAIPVGVTADELDVITAELHDRVTSRAEALGLNVASNPTILLRSISRANKSLARANAGMRQRERKARLQNAIVEGIERFHRTVAANSPVMDVLAAVAVEAPQTLGGSIVAALYEGVANEGWHLVRFGPNQRPSSIRSIDPPDEGAGLQILLADEVTNGAFVSILPWLVPLIDAGESGAAGTTRANGSDGPDDDLTAFALRCPSGGSAILLLAQDDEPVGDRTELAGLVRTWQAALAAAAEHEFTAQVTEQLAEANRSLLDVQETLARHQTLATLGEVAAGAAHEMNNPLTVISGRAQLLQNRLMDAPLRKAAAEITNESQRLSDMITALRSFAEPVVPQRSRIDLANLVMRVVQQYGPGQRRTPTVNTILVETLPAALIDPTLVSEALGELIRNACESKGVRNIELRVLIDPLEDRLRLEVRDDGAGLSGHALRHAFDPFYSDKPAGRQPGLGLSKANRFVEAHGGVISLVNAAGGGAIATIWLPNWRDPEDARRAAAAAAAAAAAQAASIQNGLPPID
ncbi:MAG: HDOD domain-containing protein [Phycisphaerales bacterium]